jgi:hypothetical protein
MDGILEGDVRLGKGNSRQHEDKDEQKGFHFVILPHVAREPERTPSRCIHVMQPQWTLTGAASSALLPR